MSRTLRPAASLLLPLALVVALAGCVDKPKQHEDVRPVRTAVVQRGDAALGATYSGDVRARREARLGFRIGGKVVARMVEVGDRVKPGQALLRLDSQDVTLQTTSSRSQYEQAKLDYDRSRQLQAKGFISQAEVDRRKVVLDAADAQFKLANNQGGYTVLYADKAGVVTTIDAEVGQVLAPGQIAVRVAEDGEREVVVSVPESRVEEVRRAESLQIALWAAPDKRYQGKLRELAPDTDPVTRTYAAKISILGADEGVRLGMTAYVSLPGVAAPSAFVLPMTAIYDRDGQPQVWVVDPKSSRVSLRKVTLAGARNDVILVSDGLQAGETVVTAGSHLLHADQLVRVAESQLARP